jgi:hypothetical protein
MIQVTAYRENNFLLIRLLAALQVLVLDFGTHSRKKCGE